MGRWNNINKKLNINALHAMKKLKKAGIGTRPFFANA